MRKLFLFIASALMSVSTMATNISGPMYASNLVENDDFKTIYGFDVEKTDFTF